MTEINTYEYLIWAQSIMLAIGMGIMYGAYLNERGKLKWSKKSR